MNRNIIITLLMILLIVPIATADINIQKYTISYDFFSGAVDANPEVCSCSTLIDKVTILNTGSFGAVFTVETNIPEYARVPYGQIQLEPGERADVDIIIEADCDFEKEIAYDVIVKSNLNREQVISRTLKITRCQSLEASLFVEKDSILPCEPLNYTIKIDNPSTFIEAYIVEPLNHVEYFSDSRYEVTVAPGQTGVVNTVLGLSCDIYGNQTANFRVTSLNNDLYADLNHDFMVEQDYAFSADIPSNMNACEDSSTEFSVDVSNQVRFDNAYKINLENAPDFISLSTDYLEVAGEGTGSFNVIANPTSDDFGDYNFLVKMVSELGDEELVRNITLNVNQCFNIFVEIESQDNPELCANYHDFEAVVRNDGTLNEKIYLSGEAPFDIALSSYVLELEPGEEERVSMTVNLPGELDRKKAMVKLTAALNDRPTTKIWSDTIEPKVFSQYSCTYAVPHKTKIYVPYDGQETFMGVRNRGIKASTFDLSFEGNDKISFEQDSIFVNPGETEFFKINVDYTDEPRNNYYEVTFTADNGVEYVYQFRIVRTNGAFLEKVWDYFGASTCKIFTLILAFVLIAAIVLFIARWSIKGSTMQGQWRYGLVLILLAVLAILVVLAVFGPPESYASPINETDPLTIQWYEDNYKVIDLNDYFKDPDNDVLTYEVSGDEPDNIDVMIDENIATFKPEDNWFGNRRIRFEATDPDGEDIISPRITLDVIDLPEYKFMDLHTLYCVYFNLIIILLILLFLFFTPWNNRVEGEGKVKAIGIEKEKGYRYYVDKEGDVARTKLPERKAKKKRKK